MEIIVTGAGGFIGGAFVRRFAHRRDVRLHGVTRPGSATQRFTHADLAQPFDLALTPDVVIHAAGRTSPWGTGREYTRDNVETTRNVIAYCERHGHPRLVYLSSSSVFYRDGHQLGMTESSPIGAPFASRYSESKYAAELLVNAYDGEHVIVRPQAVIGPGDTMLMPRLLSAAGRGRLPAVVADDGPVMTDLIHVDVLCDYLLTIATMHGPQPAYNLTNNEPVDVQLMLAAVLQRLGLPKARRRVRARTVIHAADALERLHRLLPFLGEPVLTSFGASLLVYSKTFDMTLALRDLGAPSLSLREGIDRYLTHLQTDGASA
jgi:2-alkyl-3-oxoalkanoate reductase